MKTKNTPFFEGAYLWWKSNPSNKVLCLVVETNKKGFKFVLLSNLKIMSKNYDDKEFTKATKKDARDFWNSEPMNLYHDLLWNIFKKYRLEVPKQLVQREWNMHHDIKAFTSIPMNMESDFELSELLKLTQNPPHKKPRSKPKTMKTRKIA